MATFNGREDVTPPNEEAELMENNERDSGSEAQDERMDQPPQNGHASNGHSNHQSENPRMPPNSPEIESNLMQSWSRANAMLQSVNLDLMMHQMVQSNVEHMSMLPGSSSRNVDINQNCRSELAGDGVPVQEQFLDEVCHKCMPTVRKILKKAREEISQNGRERPSNEVDDCIPEKCNASARRCPYRRIRSRGEGLPPKVINANQTDDSAESSSSTSTASIVEVETKRIKLKVQDGEQSDEISSSIDRDPTRGIGRGAIPKMSSLVNVNEICCCEYSSAESSLSEDEELRNYWQNRLSRREEAAEEKQAANSDSSHELMEIPEKDVEDVELHSLVCRIFLNDMIDEEESKNKVKKMK